LTLIPSSSYITISMVFLDKLWDDVVAGPQPDKGLKQLRSPKLATDISVPSDEQVAAAMDRRRSGEFLASQEEARRMSESIAIKKPSLSSPLPTDSPIASPGSLASTPPASPSLASPSFSREKENVWRSVFHPGSNRQVMRRLGSDKFDNAQPNSPSVYDWLYSKDTKTEWR
jgi:hypothetical protein